MENELRTQIVLLGTGTPNPDPERMGSAVAIIVDDTPYLVDFGPGVVRRAAAACYAAGSLKDLPVGWREACFEPSDQDYCLRPEYRASVDFRCRDLRSAMPSERFDLILCRNLAFTYFSTDLQQRLAAGLRERLRAGGALLIGAHESLPAAAKGLTPWDGCPGLFRATARRPRPARGS